MRQLRSVVLFHSSNILVMVSLLTVMRVILNVFGFSFSSFRKSKRENTMLTPLFLKKVFLNSTNPKEYGPDQAKVLITHVASSFEKLEIWTTSSDCYECLEWPSSLISLGETITCFLFSIF